MVNFSKLSAPFPPHEVEWRVGSTTQDKKRGMALAYIDARAVMERLDEVCGPGGWQDTYTETPKGRVVCTIRIKVGDEWIAKSDGAGDTAVEGEKGGISDAFKRAAVKWGVGRYLYDMETPWVSLDQYKNIAKDEMPRLRAIAEGNRPARAPAPQQPAPQTPREQQQAIHEPIRSTVFLSYQTAIELAATEQDLNDWHLKHADEIENNLSEEERAALRPVFANQLRKVRGKRAA